MNQRILSPISLLAQISLLMVVGLAIFASAQNAHAQGSRGEVSGTVKDSSGAVVNDADVSLINAQQVTLGRTKTDAQGR